ncbi:3-hydroxyacyl-ACP dehydratase FabZ [Rhodohalobacter barkolensis]|uniref:3-hydroxyacyl-[acyl-carrier-protein] dehydratase FabZ n=1 Tax=Rhodohalobacter barkolensis TaxID=2053187 RepID=A0A2N0VM28_9BACT|nr:3-hydroxyacyl-ACP dehydratase FabZ [Rhodohalobacter barkolensis]PKD45191.1 3-hydroxyacyl-[acyl-carrier-protein] dehydratase FabZ [Rhodohalobacter barkolensis]
MKIEEIKNYIPHRYPFLLIDRVLELEEKRIVTIKNVTVNEDYFNGHFPGAPIMPGVLQVEAMAQSGALMIMKNQVDDPDNTLMVFTGIKNAKFRKSVVPGDQLRIEVKLENQRRNFITMIGTASVDGKVVCELEASAAIVSKDNA